MLIIIHAQDCIKGFVFAFNMLIIIHAQDRFKGFAFVFIVSDIELDDYFPSNQLQWDGFSSKQRKNLVPWKTKYSLQGPYKLQNSFSLNSI